MTRRARLDATDQHINSVRIAQYPGLGIPDELVIELDHITTSLPDPLGLLEHLITALLAEQIPGVTRAWMRALVGTDNDYLPGEKP